ncbi:MAG: Na/Pi symporter [Myxococcota bacterium]
MKAWYKAIKEKNKYLQWVFVLGLLYLFLSAIMLMGDSFKLIGSEFVNFLFETTTNPFVSLFVGLATTSIIQSSSTTTSIVVGMVSGGVIGVEQAVPLIMGANIGTSVTNTIVALTHVGRKEEFKKAFAGAIIHDAFNFFTVIILFPIELATGFLAKSSEFVAHLISGEKSFHFTSPIKIIIKPFSDLIINFFTSILTLSPKASGIIILILSLAMIFVALVGLVKILKTLMVSRIRIAMDKILGESGYGALVIGILITVLVQSSSVTTSILVPMVGSGILTLEAAMPITIGANIGTTITALLASLAGDVHGLAIALAHLFFNICGTLIFYPVKTMRNIPLRLARFAGEYGVEHPRRIIGAVILLYFAAPLLIIFISKYILE